MRKNRISTILMSKLMNFMIVRDRVRVHEPLLSIINHQSGVDNMDAPIPASAMEKVSSTIANPTAVVPSSSKNANVIIEGNVEEGNNPATTIKEEKGKDTKPNPDRIIKKRPRGLVLTQGISTAFNFINFK